METEAKTAEYVRRLEKAGFSREQAEAVAEIVTGEADRRMGKADGTVSAKPMAKAGSPEVQFGWKQAFKDNAKFLVQLFCLTVAIVVLIAIAGDKATAFGILITGICGVFLLTVFS